MQGPQTKCVHFQNRRVSAPVRRGSVEKRVIAIQKKGGMDVFDEGQNVIHIIDYTLEKCDFSRSPHADYTGRPTRVHQRVPCVRNVAHTACRILWTEEERKKKKHEFNERKP